MCTINREDAEYILSTFTNTGFRPVEDRPQHELAFSKGGIGEGVLRAYDRLSAAASSR